MAMKWQDMYDMTEVDLRDKFPVTRRFFDQGFQLNAMFHTGDAIGLETVNQRIQLDLLTGDLKSV